MKVLVQMQHLFVDIRKLEPDLCAEFLTLALPPLF
jgi:hypothetical protein